VSYNFAGMAVRGSMARVLAALKESLRAHGVELEAVSPTPGQNHVNAGEVAGWTVLELEVRLMPRIAVDLSRRLRTEVLGIDVYDRFSYEHACRIVLGEPTLVYTMWQAQIVERLPGDLVPLLASAYARTHRRFPPGERERLDGGDWADEEKDFLSYFNESIAPIDVLAAALDTCGAPEKTFDLRGDLDALAMSVKPPRFWGEMSGLHLDIASE
jgi:hypothetical protein